MIETLGSDMPRIREAIEASWKPDTAYKEVSENGNPALGQCYPTSWLLQQLFPALEIVEGKVDTGEAVEKHFWNTLKYDGVFYLIDFTWQQFPDGSKIVSHKIRDRKTLNDGKATIKRCQLLKSRVEKYLEEN